MNVVLNNATTRDIGTTPVVVYTTPNDTTSHIVSCRLANLTSGSLPVSAYVYDGATNTYLAKNLQVPAGESVNILNDGKIILTENQVIKCVAGDSTSFDCIVSVMETT